MGKSNTIEQQSKANAAFQTYIDGQTKALDAMTEDALKTIESTIDTYYKKGKWDDAAPLIQGRYQHLATTSEWSLDNVSKMIDALRGAIFGGPAPEGSTKPPVSADLAETVAKMSDMTLLITSAAFNAVQGIMATFTSGSQTSIQKNFDTKELAPGLTLFMCVIENQFHRSDFLSDNTILQSGYVFETMFSIKQAGDIAKFNQVQSLIAQQDATEGLIGKFDTALQALDVTADDYDTKSTKYQASLDKLNAQNDKLKAEIDKLRAAQLAAV